MDVRTNAQLHEAKWVLMSCTDFVVISESGAVVSVLHLVITVTFIIFIYCDVVSVPIMSPLPLLPRYLTAFSVLFQLAFVHSQNISFGRTRFEKRLDRYRAESHVPPAYHPHSEPRYFSFFTFLAVTEPRAKPYGGLSAPRQLVALQSLYRALNQISAAPLLFF